MQGNEASVPLRTTTERIAQELEDLRARLERLENGLDIFFVHCPTGLDTNTVGLLQELDLLRQSTGALSDFLFQISRETNKYGNVDAKRALKKIPLRDMADRLSGSLQKMTEPGRAELF